MKPIPQVRLALICCTLLSFIANAANAADEPKLPPGKAGSLFNSFEVICNVGAPSFEHLSGLAVAMRMKVLEDESETTPTVETIQKKAWVGMLTTGPFALRAEKMSGAKGVVTSCAIEGPVPDVDEFRAMVVKAMHLKTISETRVTEGSRADYWDDDSGEGRTVIVRDMERPSGHFVQVKLVNMAKAGMAKMCQRPNEHENKR
jgi:hypothetical protein